MLGTPEHRINELEKTAAKHADDIELMMTELALLKKKIRTATELLESLRIEVDAIGKIVEEDLK